MINTFFVTGIGTGVGKTIVSAILTEALEADYWKPIQAGDLEKSDTYKVQSLISNRKTVFHPNGISLKNPMSPHAAAKIEGIKVTSSKFKRPKTDANLIIEGAGGLLVPLNHKETMMDLMQPGDKIILVSRHYLGSINHTLLSLELIKNRGLNCFGIVFNGDKNEATEKVILKMSGVPFLGRIEDEPYFDKNVIKEYAEDFRNKLTG
jgi:dethiobiotin synthetase